MKSNWSNLAIGTTASFEIIISETMLNDFIVLTGDDNLLHTSHEFALSKGFTGRVVHGMLLAASLSKLIGKFFLKDNNLYLSQTVDFRKPAYIGDCLLVSGSVVNKSVSSKTITIDTIILNKRGEKILTGKAIVKSTEL